MCEGLLDLIQQRANGRRVTSVRLRVGVRHAVLGDAFDQAFALIADGTPVAGAEVDLTITPVTVTCGKCGDRSESLDVLAVCERCGHPDVEVTGGDELVLESLLFETAEKEDSGVSRNPR
jgi:hydrogenase nickel incorporation protein HypA/HybF